ncbi:low molecular weight phosphatase family protein [Planctomicrobium sp. SH668]|uniref:arsenate-mycothiol transferase ArsC n=1 Tax=Planctomicrobium sp. SH668 TaxID=3448126 RepID=UPI003F5C4CC6
MPAPLMQYVDARVREFDLIPQDRREILQHFAEMIQDRVSAGAPVKITFICTHNSRRSHFGQIWGAVAANHYGIANVTTFSGGTEATACNPRTIAALKRVGFSVQSEASIQNPRYEISYSDEFPAQVCFSKKYDDPRNPQSDFIAVMTCSDADEKCPIVRGASKRIAIRYDDPKIADDTPEEASRYDERCQQIAREMLYAFSLVK